jgi:hypothetical protein
MKRLLTTNVALPTIGHRPTRRLKMDKAFLAFGVACIIAAVVGGGFKGLGVEIPAIRTTRRQVLLALSGAILISAQQYSQWSDRIASVDPAELVEAGLNSYDSADFGSAISSFKRAAGRGNAEAQYHYGEMLYHGEGVIPDKEEAGKWILRSAEQGFPPAEASAAMLALEQGSDTASARQWAERSSNQNDPVGLYTYAALQADSTQRLDLLVRSAEAGYAPSQLLLGMISMPRKGGRLRPMSLMDGVKWIRRAAGQGDQTAQFLLASYAWGLSSSDTVTRTNAYVWWTLAHKPHKRPFEGDTLVMARFSSLGDTIEAHLPLDKQLEAQRSADQEPGWQPRPERLYRHGH